MTANNRPSTYALSVILLLVSAVESLAGPPVHARSLQALKPDSSVVTTEQTKPAPKRRRANSKGWLRGVWEGTAYQSNTKENWTLKLTAKNRSYRIDYPSLSCGGEWKLIRMGQRTAKFREKLSYGQNVCVDNVIITILKLNRSQVAYWFVEPNQRKVNGIAVLDKLVKAVMLHQNRER